METNRFIKVIYVTAVLMFFNSLAIADLPCEPNLVGMVTKIEYGDETTTYEYDSYGKVTRVRTTQTGFPLEEETMMFEYDTATEKTAERIYRITPAGDINVATFEYDALGRMTDECLWLWKGAEVYDRSRGFGFIYGIYDNRPFVHEVLGTLNHVYTEYGDANNITTWSFGKEPDGKTERVAYEKKNAGVGVPERTGVICYYLTDEEGLLKAITHGYNGESITYEYDSVGRLTRLVRPDSCISQYQYDANGMLTSYDSSLDDTDATYQYEYDVLGRVTRVASTTTNPDPNYVRLGQLILTYDTNSPGLLKEIGYTTDEDIPGPSNIVKYEWDLNYDCLVTKVTCVSSNLPEPNLVITIDPCIPETGSYMITQYEYDSSGRLLWMVDTSGKINRTIYNDLLSDQVIGPMLDVSTSSHGRPDMVSIISYEYDTIGKETDECRWSDLRGRYVTTEKSRKQKSAHQIPQPNWWGGGGRFVRYAYGSAREEEPAGKMILLTFDEYGNVDSTIGEKIKSPGDANSPLLRHKVFGKKAEMKKAAYTACKEPVEADLNGDCKVNLKDFAILAGEWLEDQSP